MVVFIETGLKKYCESNINYMRVPRIMENGKYIQGFISALISFHNAGKHIVETVDFSLNEIEIIVVDYCSKNNPQLLLLRCQSSYKKLVYYLKAPQIPGRF